MAVISVYFGPDAKRILKDLGNKTYLYPECGRHPYEQLQFVAELLDKKEDASVVTNSPYIILSLVIAALDGKVFLEMLKEASEELKE